MASIEAARLRAGVDYPTDLSQFDRFFPDEAACAGYLQGLRWPDGFVCPKCGHAAAAWRMRRCLFLCSQCRAQTSLTAGTIFAGTRKPLRLWFIAAWEITSHKYGANAADVRRMLGLKSYETAWSWRSEEHTSELQSQAYLVCRLLLEKKKKIKTKYKNVARSKPESCVLTYNTSHLPYN